MEERKMVSVTLPKGIEAIGVEGFDKELVHETRLDVKGMSLSTYTDLVKRNYIKEIVRRGDR